MIGCFHIRLGGVAQMRFKVAELQEPLLLASNKDYQHSITQVVINICSFQFLLPSLLCQIILSFSCEPSSDVSLLSFLVYDINEFIGV